MPDQAEGGEHRPDLSVIIVSWNVRRLLVDCLTALQSAQVRGSLNIEVIVVDNASRDGSAEAARAFDCVRVIETGENLGYGRANNIGLAESTGKHLLILNPDTLPQPGSLQALVDFLSTEENAGIVSPRLLNADGSVQSAAFRFPTLFMAAIDLFPLPAFIPGRFRLWLTGSSLNGRYPQEANASHPFRIDHPLGACMLLRREAYEQAGGFDPNIRMYAEEIDLAMRYREAGWECWQVPAAKVVHFGGQSTKQMPNRMFVELWRSRLYLYRRYYPGRDLVLLRTLLATSQVVDALATAVALWRKRISREQAHGRLRRVGAVLRLALEA